MSDLETARGRCSSRSSRSWKAFGERWAARPRWSSCRVSESRTHSPKATRKGGAASARGRTAPRFRGGLRRLGVAFVDLVPTVVVRIFGTPDLRVRHDAVAAQAAEVLEL